MSRSSHPTTASLFYKATARHGPWPCVEGEACLGSLLSPGPQPLWCCGAALPAQTLSLGDGGSLKLPNR